MSLSVTQAKLTTNSFCNLATICADSSPWNTPLFFVVNGTVLYWWSPLRAVHSQNILRDERVFITMYDSSTPVGQGKGIGLYLRCIAALAVPEEFERIIALFNAKIHVPEFLLSERLVTDKAPTRLFKATILQAWENDDGQDRGYFVDVRKEIPVPYGH